MRPHGFRVVGQAEGVQNGPSGTRPHPSGFADGTEFRSPRSEEMAMARKHWLMKSEEDEYSIDDLQSDGTTRWVGVRNYEARNLMRDEMSPGDRILYYHSNAKPSGVAGIAEVASESYPDPTQCDPDSRYHDPKASKEEPRWFLVDVRFVERFPRVVPLSEIKADEGLSEMVLVKRMRLSVQPVRKAEFEKVREMAEQGD